MLDRGGSLLLRAWSDDVTLFTNGPAELTSDERARLATASVTVEERRVARLLGPGDALTAVEFADGNRRRCAGLLVPVTLHQRDTFAEDLGATPAAPGPVAVDALEVDARFATGQPGLYAAGDVSSQIPSVPGAVAAGQQAAAMIVVDLMTEPRDLVVRSGAAR